MRSITLNEWKNFKRDDAQNKRPISQIAHKTIRKLDKAIILSARWLQENNHIFILGQQFSFIWAKFNPLYLKMVCTEFEWSLSIKWFFVSVFLLFHHHIPSERTCTAFILNKHTSLCQGQAGRFSKIFLKVVNVFSLYVALIYSCSIIHVYSSKFDRDHRIISQIQIVL